MSDVSSWLNATEMNLERGIDRLRAEVRALRELWRPVAPRARAAPGANGRERDQKPT